MTVKRVVFLLLFSAMVFGLSAQAGPDFGLGIGLGNKVLENSATGVKETWNSISLRPEFSVEKFGIGLAIDLNFSFVNADGTPGFRVREADWVPSDAQSFLDLYLPMIRYVRYGFKGEPFYVAIGTIDNFLLGNGFILSNYSNTQFLPERRVSGLSLDLDGKLFNFPYFGIETIVGNLAAFDVFGGRVYTRPLYWVDAPGIRELQLGFTVVADRSPFYHERKAAESDYSEHFNSEAPVVVFGGDIRLPIVAEELVSFAVFGDIVAQNESIGGMVGIGGKLFNLVTYGAQMRFLGQNFIPNYFDKYYDLYRAQRWEIYNGGSGTVKVPAYNGWLAQLGVDVLNGQVLFDAILEGPLDFDTSIDQLNPTLTVGFHLDPDLLGGLSIDASFQKRYIKKIEDIFSPNDALISTKVGYNFGGVDISLIYDLKYDSTPGPNQVDANGNPRHWIINTTFETSFSLF